MMSTLLVTLDDFFLLINIIAFSLLLDIWRTSYFIQKIKNTYISDILITNGPMNERFRF